MSTEKEELEDQILRHQIGILECQRTLKDLEKKKKKWEPTTGDLVEFKGDVLRYGPGDWCNKEHFKPHLPDINKLMIKRNPDDHEKPDWDGQFLLKNRRGQKLYAFNEYYATWVQSGADTDIVEWLPIGDDYDKIKKAWLKAKGV